MIAAIVTLLPRGQQQPAPADVDTATLVMHASLWTARFEQSLSGVLFRERYVQRLGPAGASAQVPLGMTAVPNGTRRATGPSNQRHLESNVLLLRQTGARAFVTYRDVYRVNDRAVTDHTERLQKLLTESTSSSFEQAQKLTDASAEHNLRGFNRNINIPTMAFDYLAPAHVARLRVRQAGRDTIDRLPVLIVEFEEFGRPTLVRGRDNSEVPATGRYWIHYDSGAVLRAVIELAPEGDRGIAWNQAATLKGRMEVRLELHEALKMWVPKEMTELWTGPGRSLFGQAQYDRFQRITVSTAEIAK